MKIVADESVDFGIISGLRKLDIEVVAIAEKNQGISDQEVLQIAVHNNALLITEDKDFGELSFRMRLKHCGILLIRLSDLNRNARIELAAKTIHLHLEKLRNSFSVLTSQGIRIKPGVAE
ncbi:DUF5615 family PIN-like protein [Natronoflexus pectinivorans]|uniref:Putative nuclease of predicted toxin-antitoxin system n=1 Tax=Natronoflexus pectinivorans TaxID=682526 RepID=A0A4R2GGK8_9BACT|nr:DUF5615 family PIN-like protein [Natronoflexus pectinivorans]TCO06912.1 putative nuclease of predicted toxin-antitoxin system [Natronoflexus pectinivorans]